jgi:hypothetical protein
MHVRHPVVFRIRKIFYTDPDPDQYRTNLLAIEKNKIFELINCSHTGTSAGEQREKYMNAYVRLLIFNFETQYSEEQERSVTNYNGSEYPTSNGSQRIRNACGQATGNNGNF